EQLCEDEKGHVATYRLLVNIYQDISDVRLDINDPAMARAALDKAEGVLVAGMAQYPDSVRLREDAGQLARRIGYSLREDAPQKPLEKQLESLAIFTELAQADQGNHEAQHNLGWGHYCVALSLADTDQVEMALDHLGQGWQIIVVQCSRNPNDARARNTVTLYLDELVLLHDHLQAVDQVPTRCREAVLVLQPVIETNPDNIAMEAILDRIRVVMRTSLASASKS
ncbi:MAG: hypothetical protein VX527_12480, partial [Planctomycetota bacterium]|nr:hypothetical protein [Planctomycetota bacterium]